MIYAVILIGLVLIELAYFRIADRFNIIDKPNERSSHKSVVLRGGGIIFLFGAWIFWALSGWEYTWFMLGLTLVGLISFADDVRSLPDSLRLVVQFAAMGLMFYQLGILRPQDWWIVILALVVSVGIVNAYNFMDGINGITGGYSLAVIAPLIALNGRMGFIDMRYLLIVGISVLTFCYFNFRNKARCFAGDVGAISMAFILLFPLWKLMLQTMDFSYLVLLAVYGADTILTICHRIRLHENLGVAHRKHAFQIMANELGIPHVYVSLIYMAIQLGISAGLILLPINHYVYMGIVVVALAAAYLIFMKKYYHLHEEYLEKVRKKAKNVKFRMHNA